jgi:hypothetical protein
MSRRRRSPMRDRIARLLREQPGLSSGQIAVKLGTATRYVKRVRAQLKRDGGTPG